MSPAARRYGLALRALGWLLAARIALAMLPFAVARRWMDVECKPEPMKATPPSELAWAIQAVARRIPGTHCLARSLALNALSRRAGHATQLQLGCTLPAGGVFEAHAWVVCEGAPVPDEDLGRYVPLN